MDPISHGGRARGDHREDGGLNTRKWSSNGEGFTEIGYWMGKIRWLWNHDCAKILFQDHFFGFSMASGHDFLMTSCFPVGGQSQWISGWGSFIPSPQPQWKLQGWTTQKRGLVLDLLGPMSEGFVWSREGINNAQFIGTASSAGSKRLCNRAVVYTDTGGPLPSL